MRLYRCAVALALAGVSGGWVAAQPDVSLRLGIACTPGPDMDFRVTVENVSPSSVPIVVGGILGYHQKYLPGSVRLVVHRSGTAERLLNYVDPTLAVVAGRVDPWLVPLPSRASYAIVLPARHFVSPVEHLPEGFASPARVEVQLRTSEIEPNADNSGPAVRRTMDRHAHERVDRRSWSLRPLTSKHSGWRRANWLMQGLRYFGGIRSPLTQLKIQNIQVALRPIEFKSGTVERADRGRRLALSFERSGDCVPICPRTPFAQVGT